MYNVNMDEKYLEEHLCAVFCRYYKPSQDKGDKCLGYSVIKDLIQKEKTINFEKSAGKSDPEAETMLVQNMCPLCPFHDGDCDFILKEDNAAPCGGFALISSLLQNNTLAAHEIKDIAAELQSNAK